MRRHHIAALLGLLLVGSRPGAAQDIVDRSELKVCADPNNLPFSDEKKEGFENRIAELIGKELGLTVDYVWFPQVIGFVRNTLQAHLCDLVMGTVAGDEIMQTTNPYYFTTYVMFYRADKGVAAEGPQDPRLAGLRLGVVGGTPPADLLARYDLMAHTKPYALTVDTRFQSPTHDMIQDVVDGTIDVGFLWGPIAGYYRKHDELPLTLVPLKKRARSRPDGVSHRDGRARQRARVAPAHQRRDPRSASPKLPRSCAITGFRCSTSRASSPTPNEPNAGDPDARPRFSAGRRYPRCCPSF